MRVSDDRYNRDRRRFDLAMRMLLREARTSTIHCWTGLSGDRIRKLYNDYLAGREGAPCRRMPSQRPRCQRRRWRPSVANSAGTSVQQTGSEMNAIRYGSPRSSR